MAGTPLATAFVRIRPDLTGFRSEADRQTRAASEDAGKQGRRAGEQYGKGMTAGARRWSPVELRAQLGGTEAVKAKFAEIDANAERLKRDFPEFTAKLDISTASAKMAILRAAARRTGDSLSGSHGGLGRALSGIGTGIAGVLPGLASSVGLFGGLAVAAAGAVIALGPLVGALLPITAGFAGLAAVAVPMLSDLKTKLSTASTANDAFAAAAKNVHTAITASTFDLKAYQESFAGLPAGIQAAVKELGDAHVTWLGLSKAQRDNVIALSQNKGALKSLLPSQKTSLAALLASKKAYEELSPAQRSMADSMQGLSAQWHKLTLAVQPDIMRLFASALKVIKDLMPALEPLIKAAARALAGFFENVDKWLKSPSGKKFLHWLETQGPKDIANFGKDLWTFARDAGSAFKWLVDSGTKLDRLLTERWRDVKVVSQDLRNWIWRDFVQKISNFFTNTIPNAVDILRDDLHIAFDRIAIFAGNLVLDITTLFGHLPGKMGQPFRDASAAIRTELGHMRDDVARTAARISAEWDKLHGKHVALIFSLDLPPGVTLPSRHIKGRGARGIQGAAAGTWLVGEEGPELAFLPRGTHVLPASKTSRIMGGLAGGTTGPRFGWELPATGGLGAAFQSAINDLAREIRKLIGVLHVTRPGGGSGALGGDAAANKALAARMFPFAASQWAPFVSLEMAEAGFNRFARNPSSGAYGIPQALPPTKMPFAAQAAGGSHAGPQLAWMFSYIASRWGSPANAWANELRAHWYGRGGLITEPVAGIGLRTGRGYGFGEHGPERVTPGTGMTGDQALARLDELINAAYATADAVYAAAGMTGDAVGTALSRSARRAGYRALYGG